MALPQNVIQELQNWLTDITQKWNGKNETGVDFGTHGQIDIPVYSLTSGKVIGSGYYAGGGVVAIQSNINYAGINGPASIYYQHLDQNLVQIGQDIVAGQEIGLSGGQLSGGSHPSTRQFSSGPHLEIGINAPYSANGIWANRGPNVDPLGFFQALLAGNTNVLGIGSGPTGSIPSGTPQSLNPFDIAQAIANLPQGFSQSISDSIKKAVDGALQNLGISGLSDIGWRAALIIGGFILAIIGVVIFAFDLLDKSNVEVVGTRV